MGRKSIAIIKQKAFVGMYEQGVKVDEIAQYNNVHFTTVYNYLRKHGIILRTTPSWSKFRKAAQTKNMLQYKLQKLGVTV